MSFHRRSLWSLWVLTFLVGCAPTPEPGGVAEGVESAVPVDTAPILTEGRFAGFELGDYAHLSVERTLGPDCDFWGVGGAEPALVDRLETDPALLGREVIVAHDRSRRFVPEAQEELLVAETHSFTFAGGASLSSEASSPGARIDAVRRAAHAYVTDVSGVDGPLRIEDVGISGSGDDAVAVAIYGEHPSPGWSHSWVFLKRRGDGWLGVEYGSGLQPPPWYLCSTPAADDDAGTSWVGYWVWEEDGVRHGGNGDGGGIYSTVLWTLEVGPEGRGRLSVDGLQTFEEYAVEIDGDDETALVVLAGAVRPRAGTTLAPGDTLLTLYRSGHKVLTRLGRLGPRLEPEGDVWAVRFRR